MGGQNTEIRDDTKDVLLESAYFKPTNIRRTSKVLGLRSESSYRFERGADINICDWASRRAAQLILETAGGSVVPGAVDPSTQPGGDGYGTAAVDAAGNLRFSGTLGDGTKISPVTFLSASGQWPFYSSLYSGKGSILGWLTFSSETNTDVSGPLNWFKLPQAAKFSGYSLFVSRRSAQPQESLRCASAIGAQMKAIGLNTSRYHADRVLGENRPFADEENGVHYFDNLAVGHAPRMPSLLIEPGVVVNPRDEQRVTAPAMRRAIADAIARGVSECLK